MTVVDATEFFEYTPGVLRANVKPAHLDALTFNPQPVLERRMGVKFMWIEVKSLNGKEKTATIKHIFFDRLDTVSFDCCMICSGSMSALPLPRRILVVPHDSRGGAKGELLGSRGGWLRVLYQCMVSSLS